MRVSTWTSDFGGVYESRHNRQMRDAEEYLMAQPPTVAKVWNGPETVPPEDKSHYWCKLPNGRQGWVFYSGGWKEAILQWQWPYIVER